MMNNRRNFIKMLVAFPLAGLFRKESWAMPGNRHCVLNRFYIAGFKYYRGPELLKTIEQGQELILVAEPANPHDHFAVEILCKGEKTGYVPRTDNRHLSRLIRQGASLKCRAVEVNPENDPGDMVKVEVQLVA